MVAAVSFHGTNNYNQSPYPDRQTVRERQKERDQDHR